jgi:hypothetical protein
MSRIWDNDTKNLIYEASHNRTDGTHSWYDNGSEIMTLNRNLLDAHPAGIQLYATDSSADMTGYFGLHLGTLSGDITVKSSSDIELVATDSGDITLQAGSSGTVAISSFHTHITTTGTIETDSGYLDMLTATSTTLTSPEVHVLTGSQEAHFHSLGLALGTAAYVQTSADYPALRIALTGNIYGSKTLGSLTVGDNFYYANDGENYRITNGAVSGVNQYAGAVTINTGPTGDAGTTVDTTACIKVDGTKIFLYNLPEADPHIAHQLWSNSNVLTRSAG